jgi:hypothetical protein
MANHAAGDRNGPAQLSPTYIGYIATTMDALVLFEACLSGRLSHVPRRPHDRERPNLIRSGNVFIYEEHSSGIKRWTDGVPWSPSRILGNFLIYRELDRPFQPGEKKRAMKRPKADGGGVTKPANAPRANSMPYVNSIVTSSPSFSNFDAAQQHENRHLIGSLVDSYQFKLDGLVKKTISIQFRNVHHHMVSYYTIEDVLTGRLGTPTNNPDLAQYTPRPELISNGNFRSPIDDCDLVLDSQRQPAVVSIPRQLPEYSVMAGPGGRSMSTSVVHQLQPGWPASANYVPDGYQSVGALPPANYTAATGSSYSYASNPYRVHQQPNFGHPTDAHIRRHSTVPNMTQGSSIGYPNISSVDRSQLNAANTSFPTSLGFATPSLPANSAANGGLFGSPSTAANFSHADPQSTAVSGAGHHTNLYGSSSSPTAPTGFSHTSQHTNDPSGSGNHSRLYDTDSPPVVTTPYGHTNPHATSNHGSGQQNQQPTIYGSSGSTQHSVLYHNGHLGSGFDSARSHLQAAEFNPEPTTADFGSGSSGTTPTSMPFTLHHSDPNGTGMPDTSLAAHWSAQLPNSDF